MSDSKTTTDHDTIRKWAEARDGNPARVEGSGVGGILRIDFEPMEDRLQELSWREFFKIFDENKLAFLYQDKTADGSTSRFCKFISRD